MSEDYNMMSNDELETIRLNLTKEFDKLKVKCSKLSQQMVDLSNQYKEINNILDKRKGKCN